jgi:hypothetical protein
MISHTVRLAQLNLSHLKKQLPQEISIKFGESNVALFLIVSSVRLPYFESDFP